jgi:hypothetical protein
MDVFTVKDDDDLFIPDPDDNNDNPETWINWVRTPGGKNIPNGGTTTSTKVVVDFQGTVSGQGSHIDLKIDDGRIICLEGADRHQQPQQGCDYPRCPPESCRLVLPDNDTGGPSGGSNGNGIDEPPILREPIPPRPAENDTTTCPNMSSQIVQADKAAYKPGDIIGVIGEYTSNILQQDEDGYISFRMYDSDGNPFGLENLILPKASDKGPCWLAVKWYASNLVLGTPLQLENGTVIYKPGMWRGVAEFGGSKSSFAFRVLPMEEEDEQQQPQPPPPKENITIPPDLKLPWRIYGDQKELCIEDVTKAFALLKTRAPFWYDYVMKSSEAVSCNSRDTGGHADPITAWWRVIVLGKNDYSNNNPDDPYWIAGVAVHETCHNNQFWSLRILSMSDWASEVECALYHIAMWKEIGAPQWIID